MFLSQASRILAVLRLARKKRSSRKGLLQSLQGCNLSILEQADVGATTSSVAFTLPATLAVHPAIVREVSCPNVAWRGSADETDQIIQAVVLRALSRAGGEFKTILEETLHEIHHIPKHAFGGRITWTRIFLIICC